MATINGTSGNDTLFGDQHGFPENDRINGLDGDDYLVAGGGGNDTLVGGTGNDSLQGGGDNDILDGGTGDDYMQGSSGNDLILGGSGTDYMDGGGGNDTLNGGTGNDFLIGNFGDDLYIVDSTADSITEYSDTDGTDTVQSSVSWTLGNFLENLTLTGTAAITGTGNSLSNILNGNSGNNGLTGGDGNDTLNGGAGKDTLIGGAGNDTYVVDSTTDTIVELGNGGIDTVLSSVSYTLGSSLDNLTLTGTGAISGTGNGNYNTITGNAADNTLNGGAGKDTLIGGAGNDTYVVDSTTDTIVELGNGGIDTVLSSVSYTLGSSLDNLTLTGTGAISGTGNGNYNTITGNAADNTLNGGAGNDTLTGLSGNDTLAGGAGNDSLTGGGGNDTFSYATGTAFSNTTVGLDRISDFHKITGDTDRIALSKKTFTALTSNVGTGFSKSSEFAVVTNDAAAATSSAFIVYNQGTGDLFYNQNGSLAGLGTGAEFATLTNHPLLTGTNFVIQT